MIEVVFHVECAGEELARVMELPFAPRAGDSLLLEDAAPVRVKSFDIDLKRATEPVYRAQCEVEVVTGTAAYAGTREKLSEALFVPVDELPARFRW